MTTNFKIVVVSLIILDYWNYNLKYRVVNYSLEKIAIYEVYHEVYLQYSYLMSVYSTISNI